MRIKAYVIFYNKFHPPNEQRMYWLLIGISLAATVSTSAIAYAKTPQHPKPIPTSVVIDRVFVDKSDRVLTLMSDGKAIRSYRIALGVVHRDISNNKAISVRPLGFIPY